MDTPIEQFIASQPVERQDILKAIHAIIVEEDKTIAPVIEGMMGKEMIVYKDRGMMKYALASVKKYMSLHLLPMYGSAALYDKYRQLLTQAAFQKGCINFETAAQMPLAIVRQLLADCAPLDMIKMREDQLQERKQQKKAKK